MSEENDFEKLRQKLDDPEFRRRIENDARKLAGLVEIDKKLSESKEIDTDNLDQKQIFKKFNIPS